MSTGHARTPRPAHLLQDASGLHLAKTMPAAFLSSVSTPLTALLPWPTHAPMESASQRRALMERSAHRHQEPSGSAPIQVNVSAQAHAQTPRTALLHQDGTGHVRIQASALFSSVMERTALARLAMLLHHHLSLRNTIRLPALSLLSPRQITMLSTLRTTTPSQVGLQLPMIAALTSPWLLEAQSGLFFWPLSSLLPK